MPCPAAVTGACTPCTKARPSGQKIMETAARNGGNSITPKPCLNLWNVPVDSWVGLDRETLALRVSEVIATPAPSRLSLVPKL